MKFQVAADNPKVVLGAAGLAIAFCTYLFSVVALQASDTSHNASLEELVYRHVGHSAGGCSRSELSNTEVSTEALTGFATSQLKMMPSSFWRYDGGTVRISFVKTSTPCKGASCNQEDPTRKTTFAAITQLSRALDQQTALASCTFTLSDVPLAVSTSLRDSIYVSMSYTPMDRPPRTTRT